MATNFIETGDRIKFDPGATVTSGQLVLVGTDGVPVICLEDGVSGDEIVGKTSGVFEYAVAAAATATDPGDPAYYDAADDEITDDADTGTNVQVGVFWHDGYFKLGVAAY